MTRGSAYFRAFFLLSSDQHSFTFQILYYPPGGSTTALDSNTLLQSLTTSPNLKHLRWIAYELRRLIVFDVKKEVLPASRQRGLHTLPRET